MEKEPNDPNSENLKKFLDQAQLGAFVRLHAELQVLREVLCAILAKDPSILQGKQPSEYLETKTRERMNAMLAGVADISASGASVLASFLMPKKNPPHD